MNINKSFSHPSGLVAHLASVFLQYLLHEVTRSTVNFQNNAQVQINAWFKLTPGTKQTVYNL